MKATMVIAAAMLAFGSVVALAGVRRARQSKRVADAQRAECLLRGFRLTVVGLATLCIGAGLLWSIDWLVVLALVIGGEELLESSVMIAALGLRTRDAARA